MAFENKNFYLVVLFNFKRKKKKQTFLLVKEEIMTLKILVSDLFFF